MNTSSFFFRHIDVVFFFYGLAFFSMGLAVWLESRRNSEFRIARAMGFLAAFGLIHGIHEWMDMFQFLGKFDTFTPDQRFFFNGLRIGDLLLSFLFLVIFGISLIYSNHSQQGNERTFAFTAAGLLGAFWLCSIFLTRVIYNPPLEEMVIAADVLARYIAGIPGALLAGWAILLEQRAFKARQMPEFGRALLWAAIALYMYGLIGQLFTKPSFLFPANIINSTLFFEWFGIPIQLFRALMAVLMAVFVIRALNVFEVESRQKLDLANQARLKAQQDTLNMQEKTRIETEALNQELQTAVQELWTLFDLSHTLASTLDKEKLLQTTISQIFDHLPRIEGGIILLREKETAPLTLVARSGYKTTGEHVGTSRCPFAKAYELGVFVVETGQMAWCNGGEMVPLGDGSNLAEIQAQQPLPPEIHAHSLGVPIIIGDKTMGCLVIILQPQAFPFSERDLSLIRTIAGQLGMALENATLYAEVQARDALRGELLHQVVSAQEKERQRVARELHDGTGQTLTALGLVLAAVHNNIKANPEQALIQMNELKHLSDQALQDVYDVIADLRPSVLDNLGLVAALRSQIKLFSQRTGIQAHLSIEGTKRRLDSDVETIAFRIVQEALTNIIKHAYAQTTQVNICFKPTTLCLDIIDDGQGFDPDRALNTNGKQRYAWGLLGMQERAALVNGRCQISSQLGQGTTIEIILPLPEENHDNQLEVSARG